MDSENIPHPYEDNRDAERSRQSLRSTGKDSDASLRTRKREKSRDANERESCAGDRARTRIKDPDPDRDRMSDSVRRRSSGSFYSEDYENVSPSERSLSPYSRTPSPSPHRGGRVKRVSSSPLHKTAVRRGVSRPQRPGGPAQTQQQQQRWGVRSQSKDSAAPPKDLDLVTKRMLSARLLKINELRNALAELQLRSDELQKENRVLRQLQHRQERALHRYDDTESEIAQLLARHSNETHALRERLRRTQETERAAERRLKEVEEQLQRSQAALGKLRRLADQQELGPREELTRRLEQEKAQAQEGQRKIKELERSMELNSGSFQRQLAAERRKTINAQEEVKALQEELERLSQKLKEKERELDTKNIYANRMMKPSPRKDTDNGTKRKAPSRNTTKAVQTDARTLSLGFPSPPPAITDSNEYGDQAPDDYLSLKELDETDRRPRVSKEREERQREQQRKRDVERERERERERVKERELEKERQREKEEKQRVDWELHALEEKARRLRDGWEKEKEEEEERKRRSHALKEEENRKRRGLVQEEVARRNQEALASQDAAAEEERRRKEQLLARLREIDRQSQPHHSLFSDADRPELNSASVVHSPSLFSEPKNQNPSIFSFTEPEETGGLRGSAASSREGGGRGDTESGPGPVRRGVRAQMSSEDLAFGSYAPSFGRPAPRGNGFPPPPPREDMDAVLGGVGISLGGSEKERGGPGLGKENKSSLMQQLFGPPSSSPPAEGPPASSKMEIISPPASTGGRGRREGLFVFDPEPAAPPAHILSTLHVTESRPAVRAIPSFDDDIEELTL